MKKLLQGLTISGAFALALCSGYRSDSFETTLDNESHTKVVNPKGIHTGVILNNQYPRNLDLNAMAVAKCEALYTARNYWNAQPCTVNIRDTRSNPEEQRGFVKADCNTSLSGNKYCTIRTAYKPS